jgi:hypothetical protein
VAELLPQAWACKRRMDTCSAGIHHCIGCTCLRTNAMAVTAEATRWNRAAWLSPTHKISPGMHEGGTIVLRTPCTRTAGYYKVGIVSKLRRFVPPLGDDLVPAVALPNACQRSNNLMHLSNQSQQKI